MHEVTRVLTAIEQGDPQAAEQLLPLVYDELRKLAAAKMAQENPGQTLQATALVHEAYLRLVDVEKAQHWDSRGHFYVAAAEAMRRILVESARRKGRQRYGGERHRAGLLGSWTAGTLASNATVEGIATDGTDVWIVDAKSDKVYKYAGAATRLSGSQIAASTFSLNSGNTSPKDIVAGAASLWVVNDSTTDKVFKYTTAGALISSWTITTPGATSPTGITIDLANVTFTGNVWIVDSGTDRVYQYNAAASLASGSSKAANVSFALAAGNTNPQGIADPPAPGSMVAAPSRASSASASQALDAAMLSLLGGNAKPNSTKATSTVAAKPALASIPDWASPRATTLVSPTVAAAKPQAKVAARRGSAVHATDQAMTAFADDDLKTESALQSLTGSRA